MELIPHLHCTYFSCFLHHGLMAILSMFSCNIQLFTTVLNLLLRLLPPRRSDFTTIELHFTRYHFV